MENVRENDEKTEKKKKKWKSGLNTCMILFRYWKVWLPAMHYTYTPSWLCFVVESLSYYLFCLRFAFFMKRVGMVIRCEGGLFFFFLLLLGNKCAKHFQLWYQVRWWCMMGSSFLVFCPFFVAFLFIWLECNSEDLFNCLLDRDAQIDWYVCLCLAAFGHCFLCLFFLDWIVSIYLDWWLISLKHWKCRGMKKSFVRFIIFLLRSSIVDFIVDLNNEIGYNSIKDMGYLSIQNQNQPISKQEQWDV